MKKVSLIAGMASLAAVAAVLWSLPVAAYDAHDKEPLRASVTNSNNVDNKSTADTPGTSVPEPGTLALLSLGLGALGVYSLSRRKRVKA